MKLVFVALMLVVATACATRIWLRPLVMDDYPSVRVRIYRDGVRCRIEVVTATDTIQTLPTRCVTISHVKH